MTSVSVVTKTAEETAGSMRRRRSSSGTPAPASPATSMLPSMAKPRTRPKVAFSFPRVSYQAYNYARKRSVNQSQGNLAIEQRKAQVPRHFTQRHAPDH